MIRRSLLLAAAFAAAAMVAPPPLSAQPEVVEKRTFEGGEYRTRAGGVIPNLRIG